MHAFEPRRIDENLEQGTRQRQGVDLAAFELEGDRRAPFAVAPSLKEIRAQSRVDQVEEAGQDAIVVEARDLFHLVGDRAPRRRLGFAPAPLLEARIETGMEQSDKRGG